MTGKLSEMNAKANNSPQFEPIEEYERRYPERQAVGQEQQPFTPGQRADGFYEYER